MHPRIFVSEKYAHPNNPLNQGNLHELKLRLKIVTCSGIEVGPDVLMNGRHAVLDLLCIQ